MTTWCDATTAVQVVESGNRVYVHGMCATPTPLIEALVARGEELRNVEIVHSLAFGPAPQVDPRWVGHFHVRAFFVTDNIRSAVNAGPAPGRLRRIGRAIPHHLRQVLTHLRQRRTP
ncbi:MAG TPA: hypothetical protein VKE41_02040 [Roseiflexaceae bacterium]|nr:hypothetical protein [Roseiflexaceae bacterium]